VSSLLVVFIPGLLMLATFGLQRIESGLDRDTVSATDVAEFLAQAQAADFRTLARDGMPEALVGMHRRLADGVPDAEVARAYINDDEWSDLPTPLYADSRANPEFQPSRHANPV
jgi:hypothetical protein